MLSITLTQYLIDDVRDVRTASKSFVTTEQTYIPPKLTPETLRRIWLRNTVIQKYSRYGADVFASDGFFIPLFLFLLHLSFPLLLLHFFPLLLLPLSLSFSSRSHSFPPPSQSPPLSTRQTLLEMGTDVRKKNKDGGMTLFHAYRALMYCYYRYIVCSVMKRPTLIPHSMALATFMLFSTCIPLVPSFLFDSRSTYLLHFTFIISLYSLQRL